VFPFLKVFREDRLEAFEAAASILLNWFQPWVAVLPGPPTAVLAHMDGMLLSADPGLHAHLCLACRMPGSGEDDPMRLGVFWPLLQTLLVEVLEKEMWLSLWDHLVAHWEDPELLPAAVVAFLLASRLSLMNLPAQCPHQIEEWLLQPHAITMPTMLQSMNALRAADAARRSAEALPEHAAFLIRGPAEAFEGDACEAEAAAAGALPTRRMWEPFSECARERHVHAAASQEEMLVEAEDGPVRAQAQEAWIGHPEGPEGDRGKQLDALIHQREAELETLWQEFDAEVRDLSKEDFLNLGDFGRDGSDLRDSSTRVLGEKLHALKLDGM